MLGTKVLRYFDNPCQSKKNLEISARFFSSFLQSYLETLMDGIKLNNC